MPTITDNLKAQIEVAIEHSIVGEDVLWDVGMIVLPQSPPAHFLTMLMPSAILGDHHQAGAVIEQAHKVTQEDADTLVRGMIETLQAERSKTLGKGTAALPNQEAPPKSLIVP